MSPEVWLDARAIILDTAANYGLAVELPNEDFDMPNPPSSWISIDLGGDASETLEIGNRWWEERGAIWVHVMVPFNSGVIDGLTWRKAFSVAFRGAVPTVEGLYYRDHAFDPLGADDGIWRRLSLIVRYEFDDILVNTQLAHARMAAAAAIGVDAA